MGMRTGYINRDVVALEQTLFPAEWLMFGTVSLILFVLQVCLLLNGSLEWWILVTLYCVIVINFGATVSAAVL